MVIFFMVKSNKMMTVSELLMLDKSATKQVSLKIIKSKF